MLEVLLCPGSPHIPCQKTILNKIFSQCWKLLCITRKSQHLSAIVQFALHRLVPAELRTKQV